MRYSIANNHIYYRLQNDGKILRKYLHVLIAEIFISIPDRYKDVPMKEMVVHHIDFNPYSNEPSNLQWMTRSEHQLLHMTLNPPFKGKHHSEETRKKISTSKKGQSHPHTKEWNEKIGKAHGKPIKQIDKKTDEVLGTYLSIKEAGRETGILSTAISNCLNGYSKSAGGYKWRYAD